ncbi:MAG: hypothetical protein [Microviridae sp.]|nr:MAG: hypothetical protein [Microviridae sp.]
MEIALFNNIKTNKMYKTQEITRKYLAVNNSYQGESIEIKIQRLVKNKEPLDGTVPLTYTEKKDGVLPEYNIRTDKWEVATEAMDKAVRSKTAQGEAKIKAAEEAKAAEQSKAAEQAKGDEKSA